MGFIDQIKDLEKQDYRARSDKQKVYSKIEKLKQDIIYSRDAIAYKKICDSFGLDPEISDLYELGEAIEKNEEEEEQKLISELEQLANSGSEEKQGKQQKNPRSDNTSNNAYKPAREALNYHDRNIVNFLNASKKYRTSDFSSQANSKRRILAEHFPGRFGENGTQHLSRYTDAQVGSLFNKVYSSYKKKYSNLI